MASMTDTNNKKKISENFRAIGTDVSVEIVEALGHLEPKGALSALEKVKNIFAKNEKIFSRFDAGSELSKINQNLNQEVVVSTEMFEVLELCLKFYKLSDGFFDPRVIETLEKIGYDKDFKLVSGEVSPPQRLGVVEVKPRLETFDEDLENDLVINPAKKTVIARKRIDTTGIAKGFTVDEAVQYLKKQGFENFVVDAGGDMFAQGRDAEDNDWTIGIEGLADDKVMLKLNQEGIATSGISRKRWTIGDKKFHHLINPKDPEKFSHEIKTVTVIESKTVEADGRAKVLVLMGKEKGLEFANRNNLKALFLDYKGNVYISEAMKENVI
ncbi:MAG: FAD:protein FMN transferase [Parcubacteria group bacterium]|jgi:thiamine biosynthesis lipoprotein